MAEKNICRLNVVVVVEVKILLLDVHHRTREGDTVLRRKLLVKIVFATSLSASAGVSIANDWMRDIPSPWRRRLLLLFDGANALLLLSPSWMGCLGCFSRRSRYLRGGGVGGAQRLPILLKHWPGVDAGGGGGASSCTWRRR
jgi:hypothetical protein